MQKPAQISKATGRGRIGTMPRWSPRSDVVPGRRRAASAAAWRTSGSVGSTPSSYSKNHCTGRSPRGARRAITRTPASAVDGHVPLEDHARGDPLADQLEQAATGSPSVARVLAALLAPLPTSDTRSTVVVGVPVGGLDLLPWQSPGPDGLRAGSGRRARRGCRRGRRRSVSAPGQDPLPRPDRRRGGRRRHGPHWSPIASSRSVRRCCSRATSSPNIRLYSAGVLDRVGALQPRLQLGDPAHAR